VQGNLDALRKENPSAPVAADLVTTSASGLDPDISPEAATSRFPVLPRRGSWPKIKCGSSSANTSRIDSLDFWASRASMSCCSISRWTVVRRMSGGAKTSRDLIGDGGSERRPPNIDPRPKPCSNAARREEGRVGKLRIFVGAAPGVGKTYEMPATGPRPQEKTATTSSPAIVETHDRRDTEALLAGLEIVPRRLVVYKRTNARGNGPRCHHRPPARKSPWSTNSRTPMPRQPPPQALPRRRGTDEPRHRRLHHDQHPAHRKP